MLTSIFKEILESPFDIDRLSNTIIIAGSEDIILNIGSACKTFFDPLKPEF